MLILIGGLTVDQAHANVITTVAGPDGSYAQVQGQSCNLFAGDWFSGCGSNVQINEVDSTSTSITGEVVDPSGIPAGSGVDFPLIQADLAGDFKMKGSATGGNVATNIGGVLADRVILSGDTAMDGVNDGLYTDIPVDLHLTGTLSTPLAQDPIDPNVPVLELVDFGLSGFAIDSNGFGGTNCGVASERISNFPVFQNVQIVSTLPSATNVTVPNGTVGIDETVHLTCTTPSAINLTSYITINLAQASLDFSGTATLTVTLPNGVQGTSASGAFANFISATPPPPPPTSVPEPPTLALLAIGVLGLALRSRKRLRTGTTTATPV